MGYLGDNIPKLGFGLMRLPAKDDGIDIAQTSEMTDLFLDAGFTYFDTAYGYNEGKSEEAAKAALVSRYPREKFQLATKLPAWAGPKTAGEAQDMLRTSLDRTGAGYFDFYLLHNLSTIRTKSFDDFGIWDFVQEQKAKGLIRHIGFSFHDKADYLDSLLSAHPEMEFVQLQINYGDWESAAVQSRKCYEVAKKHNKPIVIMEPVKGGMLANPVPEVSAIFNEANPKASYSSWAIRYCASLDSVITVLSGMSSTEQMKDNISFMKSFRPLDAGEQAVIKKVQDVLAQIPSIPCTACEYCVSGCPEGVAIPQIFEAYNREIVFKDEKAARNGYYWETKFGGKASACIDCGKCTEVCPQQIDIPALLKEAAAKYE